MLSRILISRSISRSIPLSNRPLLSAFATKAYPPPPPVFDFIIDQELQEAMDKVIILKQQAVEVQRKYDTNSVFEYFRMRLGFTSNKIEGNSFSENEVYKYLKTGIILLYSHYITI